MNNTELIKIAKRAREFSCADISKFKVGAALLTKNGEVISGCNIEDPSGLGVTNICAERCAVIKALSEGHTEFEKIAVVGGKNEMVSCMPCGICRQYLISFCPQIKVVCIYNDRMEEYALHELLPHMFDERFEGIPQC